MLTTEELERFPFELIRPDLERVEEAIREQGQSFDPAVQAYVSYVAGTSGKRIRPALSILAAGATGGVSDDQRKLGLVLELIHMATLVHDDIMDGAEIRRRQPTVNARWGNSLAVLLGDCLFAHALVLASEFEDNLVTRKIAHAANEVCMGEIIQTQRRQDLTLDRDTYYRIIRMKTAALFAVATELSAYLNGQSAEMCERMHSYGDQLGTAYQIYDDILDLVGSEASIGKTLGTDLSRGKLTLPMMNWLDRSTPAEKITLERWISGAEKVDAVSLSSFSGFQPAIEATVATAREILAEARANLLPLAGSEYTTALEQLTFYLDHRLQACLPAAE
jgi:octaprenyl-diphosphate synthase